jgi:choline/glycine/proline betaine transport protein
LEAQVAREADNVKIIVPHGPHDEFCYQVAMRSYRVPSFAFPELAPREGKERRHFRAEVFLSDGAQHYEVTGYTRDQIIDDFIAQYERHMQRVQTTVR